MVGAALHDPLAVLALTHRELFTSSERHVAVETHGELTRGMTVIDRRDLKERPAPNCTVLESRRLRRRLETDRRRAIAQGERMASRTDTLPASVRAHPALHARRAARPGRQPRRRAARVRPQRAADPIRSTACGSPISWPAASSSSPTPIAAARRRTRSTTCRPRSAARRERAREAAGGVTAFATDADVTVAAFALGGRLFVADLRSRTDPRAGGRRAGVRSPSEPAR